MGLEQLDAIDWLPCPTLECSKRKYGSSSKKPSLPTEQRHKDSQTNGAVPSQAVGQSVLERLWCRVRMKAPKTVAIKC